MRLWWMWSTISWKYEVWLFSIANTQPGPSCNLFWTVYWLLLQPVNHRQQPVTSRLPWIYCRLVSTEFLRKINFLCIDQYFFNLKNVLFQFYNICICTTCKHFTLELFLYHKYFVKEYVQQHEFPGGDFLSQQGHFCRSRNFRQTQSTHHHVIIFNKLLMSSANLIAIYCTYVRIT